MKRLFLMLIISFQGLMVFAQIKKGAKFFEGSLSYSSTKATEDFSINSPFVNNESKNKFTSISPGIGFLVSEKTALGFGIGYANSKREFESSFFSSDPSAPPTVSSFFEKSQILSFNIFLQKFIKLKDGLFFTPKAQLGYGFGSLKYDENGDVKNDLVEFRFFIAPSFKYFLSSRWALSGGIGNIGYQRTTEKLSEDIGQTEDLSNVQEDFTVSFGINTFSLGAQYFLNNN